MTTYLHSHSVNAQIQVWQNYLNYFITHIHLLVK